MSKLRKLENRRLELLTTLIWLRQQDPALIAALIMGLVA